MKQLEKPYIIGICGGSASGKTSLLRYIRSLFNEAQVCILSQDNYYRPLAEQQNDPNGMTNFDLPAAIDIARFEKDIRELSSGRAIKTSEYTFNNPGAQGKKITVAPAPVMVVEGIFIFHFEQVRNIFDYKIFIEAPEGHRLARRLARDKNERGVTEETIRYQWENHVLPGYEQYLLPYRATADLVINNNLPNDEKVFETVSDHIYESLRHKDSLLEQD